MSVTLNLVAIPVLAALAAGTGAVATFVNGSASTPPAATAAQTDKPCATQTWPYIDGKCMTTGQAKPQVRLVMAPRSNDDVVGNASQILATAAPAAAVPAAALPQTPAAAPEGMLTSRDTVLRQPDAVAPAPKLSKSRDKRSDQRRREKRFVAQSYPVPAEFAGRSRAVLVVRPLRLEALR